MDTGESKEDKTFHSGEAKDSLAREFIVLGNKTNKGYVAIDLPPETRIIDIIKAYSQCECMPIKSLPVFTKRH